MAVGSGVVGKSEPALVMSRMAASSRLPRTDLVLTVLVRAARCRWAAAYMVGTNSSYQKSLVRGGAAVAV